MYSIVERVRAAALLQSLNKPSTNLINEGQIAVSDDTILKMWRILWYMT
jgi:hypothetical protein